MIIDAHAHIFPDKIAEKAVAGIGGFYAQFGVHIQGNGTLSDLLKRGKAAGVARFLVQSVATVPAQVEAIN
ncbi:MAG: amidohydrolase, partial [Oscillospiraceae bacterium]|nr:amidohydrolase [Oscillospiraceae bacterium]